MKNIIYLFIIMYLFLFVTGCQTSVSNSTSTIPPQSSISYSVAERYYTEKDFHKAVRSFRKDASADIYGNGTRTVECYFILNEYPEGYVFSDILVNSNGINHYTALENTKAYGHIFNASTSIHKDEYNSITELSLWKTYSGKNDSSSVCENIDDTYLYLQTITGINTLYFLHEGYLIRITFPSKGEYASLTAQEAIDYVNDVGLKRVDIK